MTLGEKIKHARKQAGLSQEQLSEKLNVSRSAVAKWETDKGIPDIDNLKMLSKLLNVSIDYLLDNGESVIQSVVREPYDLSKFGKGIKKAKKDRAIRSKFPNEEIYTLLAKTKLTKGERIIDNALGFLTNAPFGIPDFINSIKNLDNEFYLIEKDEKQILALVTDEFIEMRTLSKSFDGRSFSIGNKTFTKCTPKVK